ncbi:nucleoside triphosphate pyrophosphatase [Fannyhessea vaginae]|jgi:septum formation protein maf|uniref:Maf family protein n=1 Tax=Fannyhessea vaginae TaxID=82135 RepID=UPI0023F42954|nr:Maf family protein [Fannyhessea vaginae]
MILASASPRRKELLNQVGIYPQIIPSSCDEHAYPNEKPLDLVQRLAHMKAHACPCTDTSTCVLAADTIVWTQTGKILGKPHDDNDAAYKLRLLSGGMHNVSTAVSILYQGKETAFVSTTHVWFYALSNEEINTYIQTGEPRDKAGAYGIQGLGAALVEHIEGDYYTVVGLPLARVVRCLRQLGVKLT